MSVPFTERGDELAARRQAVSERMLARQRDRDMQRLRQAAAIDHVGRSIVESMRRHPSVVRPFDWERDG